MVTTLIGTAGLSFPTIRCCSPRFLRPSRTSGDGTDQRYDGTLEGSEAGNESARSAKNRPAKACNDGRERHGAGPTRYEGNESLRLFGGEGPDRRKMPLARRRADRIMARRGQEVRTVAIAIPGIGGEIYHRTVHIPRRHARSQDSAGSEDGKRKAPLARASVRIGAEKTDSEGRSLALSDFWRKMPEIRDLRTEPGIDPMDQRARARYGRCASPMQRKAITHE